MGNSPSKNATSNPTLTQSAEGSSEESEETGCSGYIRNQSQSINQQKRLVKSPIAVSSPVPSGTVSSSSTLSTLSASPTPSSRNKKDGEGLSKSGSTSEKINIPRSSTTATGLASSSTSTSPLTPSSSLSTPSTVDTVLSSSSSSSMDDSRKQQKTQHSQQQQLDRSQPRNKQKPSSTSSSSSGRKRGLPIDDYIDRLVNAKHGQKSFCLEPTEIKGICRVASSVFMSQPVFLELGTPVKVVGDIHGQYGDLMRIFQTCGLPPKSNYLFLGDYVDRGKQSLETIMLLMCLKIKFPENVFLLRGNHECASVTKVYGFYDECKRRCSVKIWKSVVDVFNTFPIAATIGGKIFCVHGGLSPNLNSMDDIINIQRPTDVPDSGLMSDLLWSDPDPAVHSWGDNDRGVSYCFGKSVVDKFCKKHGFELIARGHMVVEDGYEFFNNRKLVTVFSAPNYCGEFQNWGAVMSVSKDLLCSFDLLQPLDSNNGVKRAVKVVQEAVYNRGN